MIEPVALELPLSGLTVQWRPMPPSWRLGSPAELTALDAQPEGHRGWVTMTGGTKPFARTQRPPVAGDTDPTPLWCVACWENPGHPISMAPTMGARYPSPRWEGCWSASSSAPICRSPSAGRVTIPCPG